MCKLTESLAFSHIQARLKEDPQILQATVEWVIGQNATKKLTEWCQDQWRRKVPCFPCSDDANTSLFAVPYYDEMPLCLTCGVPCPQCRQELNKDIPQEISTAYAITQMITEETTESDEDPEVACISHDQELASDQEKLGVSFMFFNFSLRGSSPL